MKVAILISGSGSNMVALVEAMQQGEVPGEPVLVIANKADAAGLQKASALGVPVALVEHSKFASKAEFEAALTRELEASGAQVVCLAGFMRILSAAFVKRWAGKVLNIHPSLLPSFKGLNTHARALAAGCTVHGATVHEVTAALDDGRIIGQAVVPVLQGDDAASLAKRVLAQEHQLYVAALRKFLLKDPHPLTFGVA